ncbi:hypothetical protein ABBQ38_001879 [Trebouxia sp. C0009 RCD-2024]
MWGQPLASKGKQYIFRGPYGYEPYPVATVNQKSHSWHGSAQVKLGDSHQVERQGSGYRLSLDPGHDHALMLCALIIIDEYYYTGRMGPKF